MKILGWVLMIVREKECNELTAGIKRLRAERNYYKRLYEDLHQRFMESIQLDDDTDIEEALVRFENSKEAAYGQG